MAKKLKYRRGVFIVVYSKASNKIYYLVLQRKLHWKGWEFPKGGVECLETKKMAIKREVREETGLKPIKIKRFNIKGKFDYNKKYLDRKGYRGQAYSLYAAKVRKQIVNIDRQEHSAYKWLEFNDAIQKLTWPNQKKCLSIVHAWLKIGKKK